MPKTKRMAYDADFKVKAIALAEEKGNRRAAFELGINGSMVRKWRKQKTELGVCKKTRKSFRSCKARWLELEAELAKSRDVRRTRIRVNARFQFKREKKSAH